MKCSHRENGKPLWKEHGTEPFLVCSKCGRVGIYDVETGKVKPVIINSVKGKLR